MKSWFVFLINGKKIGTWANNIDEAHRNLIAEFGNIPMEFVGVNNGKIGAHYDDVIYRGMTQMDKMIAFGALSLFAKLAK